MQTAKELKDLTNTYVIDMTDNQLLNEYKVKYPGRIEQLQAEVHELGQLMGDTVGFICSKFGPVEGRKRIIALQRLLKEWQKKQ